MALHVQLKTTKRAGWVQLAVAATFTLAASATLPVGDAAASSLLQNAGSWAYQLQGDAGSIARSGADVAVVDADHMRGSVSKLKSKPGGGRRIVIAYLAIGEAETYRAYYKSCCANGKPDWVTAKTQGWAGNYIVHFWRPEWKAIVRERVKQIMLNMERWRWMPDNLGENHILVNIAAFELQRVQSSVIVERMNVVTGAVATQTPEFSDEMEYVELNPTWTVPYNIATGEMLPKLRNNPYAYAADFDVFINGALSSWDGIEWYAYGPGKFPFTFRQRPGPKNALGKVKFMLPNVHNIYLHDTPAKDKFASTSRAFSHGCIRLSRAIDLAHTIIGEIPGWSNERVDEVLASGQNTKVSLPRHIPVHLIYSTAFKGENGIEFRPDVYGRDRKLYNALFGRSSS